MPVSTHAVPKSHPLRAQISQCIKMQPNASSFTEKPQFPLPTLTPRNGVVTSGDHVFPREHPQLRQNKPTTPPDLPPAP